MNRTIEAIFEQGILRPLHPLTGIPENGKVTVRIEGETGERPCVLGRIGAIGDEDAAEMLRIVEVEFERIDPSEWR